MATPYQLNFPDMVRFFDDLKHVVQTGGMNKLFQSGGDGDSIIGKIWTIFTNILKLCLIIVVIYVIYSIIFGGYPRFAVNIFTGSFYHKENMDQFIKENYLIMSTINQLLLNTNGCQNQYESFDAIFNSKLGSQLNEKIHKLDTDIKSKYRKFKYDDQRYIALRDYYLYGNVVNTQQNTQDILSMPAGDITIQNKKFYEQQLGLQIRTGEYNPKGKSDDQQLLDIYNTDKAKQFQSFNTVSDIKKTIEEIGSIIRQMVLLINNKPYLVYLISPDSTTNIDKTAFITDYSQYSTEIQDGSIYSSPNWKKLNKYSWFIIEYYQYRKNQNIYKTFENELNKIQWNKSEINTIRKYLNISSDVLRKQSQISIFNRKLVKKEPALIDPSRNAEEERYNDNEICKTEFFDFIEKHPIFSHMYFSDSIPGDKNEFYKNVMNMYQRFYTNCDPNNIDSQNMLNNLTINGNSIRKFTNSINVFDLYLNEYKDKIKKIYEDQNYADKFFFTRLFEPYYQDFVVNRMGTHFNRTFSSKSWDASYKKFLVQWVKLGGLIKNMMKAIFASFNTSANVQTPESETV